jgi:CRISP-associated protein Cas1
MYLDLDCKVPYFYAEMGRLCVKESSLHFTNDATDIVIPVGRISAIFLGPGTTVTHNAIKICAWSNCSTVWVGEDISKCYAISSSQSRSSSNLLKQIYLLEHKKQSILRKYYLKRFGKAPLLFKYTEEQIRGIEGAAMKKIYIECALKYGVPYSGRRKTEDWSGQPIYDRSISTINSFLYGLCSAVLSTLGYSTALGILHSGNMLSLSFDIADLYKKEFSIPLGFEIAKECKNNSTVESDLNRIIRRRSFEKFSKEKLLNKILSDLEDIFDSNLCSKKQDAENEPDPVDLFLPSVA